MEKRLKGKPDDEVQTSLRQLGHALLAIADGHAPELDRLPELEGDDATLTDLPSLE